MRGRPAAGGPAAGGLGRACARSSERAGEEWLTQYGIKTSGDIADILTEAIPELFSGAPDLEGATQHKRRLLPSRPKTMAGATSITASASTRWLRC